MNDLPRTLAALSDGLLQNGDTGGLHIGAQLHALLDGQIVADIALGLARLAKDSPTQSDIPMRSDTLMLWLSAGKPLTAVAIALLSDQNLLTFDDPVIKHIPEFAAHEKQNITLRHLLTHTAGIRALDTQYPFLSWQETLDKIIHMKPERSWPPGQKAGYHAHSSWYLLGEIINRITKTPFDHWIKQNILNPLQMTDTHFSLTPEQYAQYEQQNRLGYMYDTSSLSIKDSRLSTQDLNPIPNYDTELAAARPRPSASARGPIKELTNLYEMLRKNGLAPTGTQILKPETVLALISRQRLGMYDITFQKTIDFGLGIILNSSHYGPAIPYQFGPHASPQTFGHGGSQSSTAFCDPEKKLTVALLFNGTPGEPAHDQRLRKTLKALYEDLNLV